MKFDARDTEWKGKVWRVNQARERGGAIIRGLRNSKNENFGLNFHALFLQCKGLSFLVFDQHSKMGRIWLKGQKTKTGGA